LSKNKCKTEHISIHGNRKTNAIDWENHLYIYGTDIPKIMELQSNEPELKKNFIQITSTPWQK
jgi:glycerol-3-phosphate dehydrogenase